MRRLSVSTLVSLDGVIQDPGGFGEIDQGGWADPYFGAQAQDHALAHLRASGLFLCGRVTYEVFKAHWQRIKEGEYAERMNTIPKLVASTTLTGPLEWNATLIRGDVVEEITALKQTDGPEILMYGSAALMRTLMRHDLIDEYQVWVNPIVLGEGTRLFDTGDYAVLELVECKPLDTGAVILTYHPVRT
ncbi:dihydrofolate reductase family protein [Flindersiella endophytica]